MSNQSIHQSKWSILNRCDPLFHVSRERINWYLGVVTPGLPIDTEDPLVAARIFSPSLRALLYTSGKSNQLIRDRPTLFSIEIKDITALASRTKKIQYKTNIGSDEPRIPPSSHESISLFFFVHLLQFAKVIFLWVSGISLSMALWTNGQWLMQGLELKGEESIRPFFVHLRFPKNNFFVLHTTYMNNY